MQSESTIGDCSHELIIEAKQSCGFKTYSALLWVSRDLQGRIVVKSTGFQDIETLDIVFQILESNIENIFKYANGRASDYLTKGG